MIGYLKGIIAQVMIDYCLLDVNGVGYRLFISGATRQNLAAGQPAQLFTYLHVREDALLLYGFATEAEYELFLQMTSVSGIGPKVALGVLSAITPADFCLAVCTKQINVLTKLPGIGKKTAERLILELKDKLGCQIDSNAADAVAVVLPTRAETSALDEAVAALSMLGYSQAEAVPVLKAVYQESLSVEELIRLALKEFGRR